jgi:fumarate hydratase subunit beta
MIKNYSIPIHHDDITSLHAGDIIYVSGDVFTARDEAHQLLLKKDVHEIPFAFSDKALYHCGPLMEMKNNEWRVISAGPTTSFRMESFEQDLIKKFDINMIIGKGMMGEKTRKGLENKGVFLVYTGGAGALAADQITKIKEVFWLDELGMAEAVWIFSVDHFGPLVVAIDSYGNTLFRS